MAAKETAWLQTKRELQAHQVLEQEARSGGKLLPGKDKESCGHVIAIVIFEWLCG